MHGHLKFTNLSRSSNMVLFLRKEASQVGEWETLSVYILSVKNFALIYNNQNI